MRDQDGAGARATDDAPISKVEPGEPGRSAMVEEPKNPAVSTDIVEIDSKDGAEARNTDDAPVNTTPSDVAKFLRLKPVKVGDRVHCRYAQSNQFYGAKITGISTKAGELQYDVEYDDGDMEVSVPRLRAWQGVPVVV